MISIRVAYDILQFSVKKYKNTILYPAKKSKSVEMRLISHIRLWKRKKSSIISLYTRNEAHNGENEIEKQKNVMYGAGSGSAG